MPLLTAPIKLADGIILLTGKFVGQFGVSLGGSMFAGSVSMAAKEGEVATFTTEEYAATVRTSPGKVFSQTLIGTSLLFGGTVWTMKKLKVARRVATVLPLIEYQQALIGRLTGGSSVDGSIIPPPRTTPYTLEEFQTSWFKEKVGEVKKFLGFGAQSSPSTTTILMKASQELATETDPDRIRTLKFYIQNTGAEVKATAQKISTISDYIQFFNTIPVNPQLQAMIVNSEIPQDVLRLVPDVVELIELDQAKLPKSVLKGFTEMYGTEIVKYGDDVASASKQIATASFGLLNSVTQVTGSDFVMGEIPSVDDLLQDPKPLSATELQVVQEQADEIAKGVKKYEKGVKTVKRGMRVVKIGAYFNILGVIDLVYWLGSSVVDLVLNFVGIDEEDQRLEFGDSWFANNIVEPLFDLSDSVGTSPFDAWIFNPIIEYLFPEDPYAVLIDIINADYETIDALGLAILNFYADEVEISLNSLVPLQFGDATPVKFDVSLPIPKIDPLDVLAYIAVGCIVKVVFKGWVVPAWQALQGTVNSAT